MSPIARNYKEGSVIYFQDDSSKEIYILKTGRIALTSTEIDTGEEQKDEIKTGEFFGIKAVLGNYKREETAQVLTQSVVLVFNQAEFEMLISKNFNILMKLLKVFSNQLRRIGKKVRTLLDKGEERIPATELFNIGEYYFKRKKAEQAVYAYKKYMENYPNGQFYPQAEEKIEQIESGNFVSADTSVANEEDFSFSAPTADSEENFPSPISEDDVDASFDSDFSSSEDVNDSPSIDDTISSENSFSDDGFDSPLSGLEDLGQEVSEQWQVKKKKIEPVAEPMADITPPAPNTSESNPKVKEVGVAQLYHEGFSLFSQGKYNEAIIKYDEVINTKNLTDDESLKFVEKSYFDKGKALSELNKYQDAILNFTNLIKKFSRSELLKETLFLIGENYEKANQIQKAMNFYQKVIGMPPRESLNSKAKSKLEEIQSKL